jgi:cytochrome c oxidase assembly protein subunit 15
MQVHYGGRKMPVKLNSDQESALKRHGNLLLAGTVMTYLLVTMGGVVCATESGLACPDWPGCYGQIVPPMRIDAIIEYTHRFVALLTAPLILSAAIIGWRKFRSIHLLSWPPVLAMVFALAVAVFGAFAVLTGLAPGVAAVDLGSALIVLLLMTTATVVAYYSHNNLNFHDRLSFQSSFAKLSLGTLITTFIVLDSAVLVAASGSLTRCLGWPLYRAAWAPVDTRSFFEMLRSFLGGVTILLVATVVIQAWRTQRAQPVIPRLAGLMGLLFLIETLIGLVMAVRGYSEPLLVIYVALAAAVWGVLVALTVISGLTSPHPVGAPHGKIQAVKGTV